MAGQLNGTAAGVHRRTDINDAGAHAVSGGLTGSLGQLPIIDGDLRDIADLAVTHLDLRQALLALGGTDRRAAHVPALRARIGLAGLLKRTTLPTEAEQAVLPVGRLKPGRARGLTCCCARFGGSCELTVIRVEKLLPEDWVSVRGPAPT